MQQALSKLQNTMNYALTMKHKCEDKKATESAREWEARYQALKIACRALNYLKE